MTSKDYTKENAMMKLPSPLLGNPRRLVATAAAAALLSSAALAGIPTPDLVLYGRVLNGNKLLTTGELRWTYSPVDGSQPVAVTTELTEIIGPTGEVFSYVIQIPTEQTIAGESRTAGVLPLSTQPLQVNRSANLDGTELFLGASALGETVTLTLIENSGSTERVDLDLIDPDDCCPGDANRDGFVNLTDYRSVRDHFGDPTPALGDASCDGFVNLSDFLSVRDNLGATCEESPGFTARSSIVLGENPAMMYPAAASSEIAMNRRFDVRVYFEPNGNDASIVGGFVDYNPAELDFVGGKINREAFGATEFTSDPLEIQPGRVSVTGGSSSTIGGSRLEVATLTFEPRREGTAAISFVDNGPFAAAALDSQFDSIPVSVPVSTLNFAVRSAPPVEDEVWVIF